MDLEARVNIIEQQIKNISEDIEDIKDINKEFTKALAENTKAQIENTIGLKEFKAYDEERRRQDEELMKAIKLKLEEINKSDSIKSSELFKKTIEYSTCATVGGMIAYCISKILY